MKTILTDRAIRALKPAPAGKRTMIWDAAVPSFGVRVTDKGSASFVIMRRLDGKLIRRTLGPAWTVPLKGVTELPFALADARQEAREALLDIHRGIDPKEKRAAARRERQQRRENTFAVVAEAFIADHVSNLRSAANVASTLRKKIIPVWRDQPIVGVTKSDIIKLIRETGAKQPFAAYHSLAYLKKLFSWAIAQDIYGLHKSPCDGVSSDELIGTRDARQRVLADNEVREIWHAAGVLGYPFGDLTKFLLLTGQRLRECAESTWSEIDFDKAVWTIPASRMKADAAHEIPLAPAAIELLRSLPRFPGTFVFSSTEGRRPVAGFSTAKIRIDRILKDVGQWRFHDLRRTMRTHLGGLPIPSKVAELVIAHAQPGLHKVYDLHGYRAEKAHALALWANRLLSIVEPREAANVVSIAARG